MTQNLIETLKALREKISTLEVVVEDDKPTTKIIDTVSLEERLEKKIHFLETLQKDKIKINVGGKIYTASRSSIFNTKYYNILQDIIHNDQEGNEIFYDSTPNMFK